MLTIIRSLLEKIIVDIDTGNSNITSEEMEELVDTLTTLSNKNEKLSKHQACKYLHISRATFDNYVKEGKLSKGRKQQGFKELFFYKKDLDKFVTENTK